MFAGFIGVCHLCMHMNTNDCHMVVYVKDKLFYFVIKQYEILQYFQKAKKQTIYCTLSKENGMESLYKIMQE